MIKYNTVQSRWLNKSPLQYGPHSSKHPRQSPPDKFSSLRSEHAQKTSPISSGKQNVSLTRVQNTSERDQTVVLINVVTAQRQPACWVFSSTDTYHQTKHTLLLLKLQRLFA